MATAGVLVIYLALSPDQRDWVATLQGDARRVGIGRTRPEAVAALFDGWVAERWGATAPEEGT